MNYLSMLTEKDYEKMLNKIDLDLDFDFKNKPICLTNTKEWGLIFCKTRNVKNNEYVNEYVNKMFERYCKIKHLPKVEINGQRVILYISSFELFDSFNNKDYTEILIDTFKEKFLYSPDLVKEYKKDFLKYYSDLKEENKNKDDEKTK